MTTGPDNLWQLLDNAADSFPHNTYLQPYEDELDSISFAQMRSFAASFNVYLDQAGVSQSAKVLTLLQNSTLKGMLAVSLMSGSRCFVPIHPGLAPDEVAHIVSEVAPEIIIHAGIDWLEPQFAGQATVVDVSDAASFIEMINNVSAGDYSSDAQLSDLAEIVFTSGSTGNPKGVMLSQRNVLTNSRSLASRYRFDNTTNLLTLVPLYHTGGQIATTVGALWAGSRVTIVTPEKALYGFWDIIERFEINWTVALTTFLSVLLSKPAPAEPTLKGVLVGGSSVSSELIEAFERRVGVSVYQIYGLTETTSISFSREIDDAGFDLSSTGRAVDYCSSKILREDGSEADINEHGEIVIAGDHVFMGYLNRPELTADKFVDGYMKTGDLGYMDEQGYLYVIDRIDNMIICGGENIYPAEIEKVAPEISGVREFVVCSEEHDLLGESLVLVYKLEDNVAVMDETLYSELRSKLAMHKVPKKRINLSDLGFADWPRTNSGKIARGKVEQLVRTQ